MLIASKGSFQEMRPMVYGILQVVDIAAQHWAAIQNAASAVLTYSSLETPLPVTSTTSAGQTSQTISLPTPVSTEPSGNGTAVGAVIVVAGLALLDSSSTDSETTLTN